MHSCLKFVNDVPGAGITAQPGDSLYSWSRSFMTSYVLSEPTPTIVRDGRPVSTAAIAPADVQISIAAAAAVQTARRAAVRRATPFCCMVPPSRVRLGCRPRRCFQGDLSGLRPTHERRADEPRT